MRRLHYPSNHYSCHLLPWTILLAKVTCLDGVSAIWAINSGQSYKKTQRYAAYFMKSFFTAYSVVQHPFPIIYSLALNSRKETKKEKKNNPLSWILTSNLWIHTHTLQSTALPNELSRDGWSHVEFIIYMASIILSHYSCNYRYCLLNF